MKGQLFFALMCHLAITTSLASRILVLSPLGPRSHMYSFMPMVEELAERGHKMTVVTPHPPQTESPNIRKIVLKELIDMVETEWYDFKEHGLFVNNIGIFSMFNTTMTAAYDHFIANENIQEIKRNKNYDAVIIDGIVNDFVFPLVDHLGVPFIIFDPGCGANWNMEAQGVTKAYAYVPPHLGNFRTPMSFLQRMYNAVVSESLLVARRFYLLSNLDKMVKKNFPNARPIAEIERDAQLYFINGHHTTCELRPLPPTAISVPAMHTRPAKPLPEDLRKFADEAEEGLIIFTLGSNSQVSHIPRRIQDIFVQVFARLKQRVLWKWEKDGLAHVSPNVKLVDWLPQQDVLGHVNTRLLISHGGLMSNQEAIYHKVPILGLPLGRDQRILLIRASDEGYAIKMEWDDITNETLYDAIQKIISQPRFKENVARLSGLLKDEIMPAREKAAYWVEYVLRHGGARHLQTKAKNMPFYQVYLLDVWLFLFSSISLLFFILYKSLSWLLRRMNTAAKLKTQ